ncbi:uncharacterized protein RAG0_04947 [Rhynchosporium agropyri]|uniref:AB hydrolase-1 domain-containing protein n=1 Tax=Rhynchosporium agropyri TaxID=914238 RepID=A0A1E1KB12_9HELO|nr:uncharacterized protein RAG0_04947 [Rhynchosporium agropyri]
MSIPKPTFVFVPGAWHSSSCWSKIVPLLSTHNYNYLTPNLPSTVGDTSVKFADDLEAVRSAILSETTQGRDVFVVAWSYGSLPGASAIKGLSKTTSSQRFKQGGEDGKENGHVIGLALIATGFCATGLDFLTSGGGKPPPFWTASKSGFAELTLDADGIRDLFYHDLPVEEGEKWVGEVTKQSLKALTEGGELVYAGWKDVPVWFLGTKGDRGLPFSVQEILVGMARNEDADVVMREVDSGHAPMLSKPEETLQFLLDAARAFVE